MVYCGKMSKACARCRTRRMKCDMAKPQCRKCSAAHVQCPGYRDELDMLFRDQTTDVVRRHSSRPLPLRDQPETTSAATSDAGTRNEDWGCSQQAYGSLDRSNELSGAVAFLFERFLRGSSFGWVSHMYINVPESSIFSQVVHATALGAYSYKKESPALLARSRSLYHRALRQLRKTNNTPEWTSDSTLASILLMSLFEVLLNNGDAAEITETWSSHVSGAFAIIRMRDEQTSANQPLNRILVEQTIHNYNLYCFQQDIPRPTSLLDACTALKEQVCQDKGFNLTQQRLALHSLSDAMSQYRRLVVEMGKKDPWMLINCGRDLEERVAKFEYQLSQTSLYQIVPVHDEILKLPGLEFTPYSDVYHLYASHHEARLWNSTRMIRLTLCDRTGEIAKRMLEGGGLDATKTEAFERIINRSRRISEAMIAEICASVPQFLRKASPDCTYAAGCFLAWPLFVVGRVCNRKCKEFVKDRLLWIGRELSVRSAYIAATELDSLVYQDNWLQALYMF